MNWSMNSSEAYKQCQIRLLKEEISNKKSIFRKRESELVLLKNHLKASMNVIDYAHFNFSNKQWKNINWAKGYSTL